MEKMDLNPLLEKVIQIKNPQDKTGYYVGCPPLSTPPLESVLLFQRRDSLELGTERWYHHRFVLIVNLSGSGKLLLDSNTFNFNQGEAVLIFPYQFHSFFEPDPELKWLFVTFELSNDEAIRILRNQTTILSERAISSAEALVEDFLSETRTSSLGNDRIIYGAGALIRELAQTASKDFRQKLPTEELPNSVLDRINRFVHANLDKPLHVSEIANKVSLSASRARAVFKEATGLSLGSYVKDVKVHRAMQLLSTTEMTVSQIAYECGYDSLAAFSRMFAEKVGKSPRDYRREA